MTNQHARVITPSVGANTGAQSKAIAVLHVHPPTCFFPLHPTTSLDSSLYNVRPVSAGDLESNPSLRSCRPWFETRFKVAARMQYVTYELIMVKIAVYRVRFAYTD